MTEGERQTGGPAPNALVVVAFGAAAFVAFAIAGLGLLSLFVDADVIEEPGLGPVPGIVGFAGAIVAWVALMAPALPRRPGVGASLLAGLTAGAAYTVGVLLGVIGVGGDPAVALGVAGRLVAVGFSAVIALAGLLAGVGAAVAVRTSDRPRWPWEKQGED